MSSSTGEAQRRDAGAAGGAALRLLARVIFGLTILGIVAGTWLSFLDGQSQGSFVLTISFILFPIVGYLLATRRPDNAVSWLTLGVGAALGLTTFLGAFATGSTMLIATRFLAGIGIGAEPPLVDVYLSELLPAADRGRCLRHAGEG